jgi:hypothetical protein
LQLRDERWSEWVIKQAVWLGGLLDFERAAQVLEQIGGVSISDSTVWRLCQTWGRGFGEVEAAQWTAANSTNNHVQVEGKGSIALAPEAQSGQFTKMGASMDGAMVHIRDEGWKELKVGCVFDIEAVEAEELEAEGVEGREGGRAPRATNQSYVAHLGGPEVFGQTLWGEAHRRGWERVAHTLVLADGAAWIWNLAGEHFYDSTQLVDWYHGAQHLASASQAVHEGDVPAAQQWLAEHKKLLFEGGAGYLAEVLADLADKQPKQAEQLKLSVEAGYFSNNAHRMNYSQLREAGYPIGSGMVESAGKQFKARFAGVGMRWSRAGAEKLLPIRTAILSSRFEQCWHLAYNSPLI